MIFPHCILGTEKCRIKKKKKKLAIRGESELRLFHEQIPGHTCQYSASPTTIIPSFETKFLSTGCLVLLCTVTGWNAKAFTVEASNADLKMQIISSPLQKYQSFPNYYKFISFLIIPKLTGSKNWIWFGFICWRRKLQWTENFDQGGAEARRGAEPSGAGRWLTGQHQGSGLLGKGDTASSKGAPRGSTHTKHSRDQTETSTQPFLLHHREALSSSPQSTNYLSLLHEDMFSTVKTKLLTCKTMSKGPGGLQIGMRDLSGMTEVSWNFIAVTVAEVCQHIKNHWITYLK